MTSEWRDALAQSGLPEPAASVGLHSDTPHPARLYNYYLGGKDHFPADRAAAEEVLAVFPSLRTTSVENRGFLRRAVRYVAEQGVGQFLDIGTGLPTAQNTHQVAQEVRRDARVVYVDNDPIVLTHARALLTGTREGRTAYIEADLREPEAILEHTDLQKVLDLGEPVALMLVAVLHFLEDRHQPYEVVRQLVDALPKGSYLLLSHVTGDFAPAPWDQIVNLYRAKGMPAQARSRADVTRFFAGLELEPPGVELVSRWRASPGVEELSEAQVSCFGAVARKP